MLVLKTPCISYIVKLIFLRKKTIDVNKYKIYKKYILRKTKD